MYFIYTFNMDENRVRARCIELSDEVWEMARVAAAKSVPKTKRPSWVDSAIRRVAKEEDVLRLTKRGGAV